MIFRRVISWLLRRYLGPLSVASMTLAERQKILRETAKVARLEEYLRRLLAEHVREAGLRSVSMEQVSFHRGAAFAYQSLLKAMHQAVLAQREATGDPLTKRSRTYGNPFNLRRDYERGGDDLRGKKEKPRRSQGEEKSVSESG